MQNETTEKKKQTHKDLIRAIRKQNGPKAAMGVKNIPLTEEVLSILAYAGDIEVDQHVKMVLEDIMFASERTASTDEFILKSFEGGKTPKEQALNQTLHQMFEVACQTKDYQELMEAVFDKKGYFAFVVNPPEADFSDAELLRRQDITQGYYKKDEELCTFGTRRFDNWFIIHVIDKRLIQDLEAVKKALAERDYDTLEKELMKNKEAVERPDNPKQEDAYGLSLPMIQIAKENGFLKMMCRWNHTIGPSCDRTLGANPDKIHPGLRGILNRRLGFPDEIQLTHNLQGNFVITTDSKIVQYYNEINGVYFAEKCCVREGLLHPFDENEISVDCLLINKDKRFIATFSDFIGTGIGKLAQLLDNELFIRDAQGRIKMDKNGKPKRRAIEFSVDKKTKDKTVMIQMDDGSWEPLLSFSKGRITALNLPTTQELPPRTINLLFMRSFSAPNLIHLHAYNFFGLHALESVFLPKVQKIDKDCFKMLRPKEKVKCYLPKGAEHLFPSCPEKLELIVDDWKDAVKPPHPPVCLSDQKQHTSAFSYARIDK